MEEVRKPPWLKKRIPLGSNIQKVSALLEEARLHTVCLEAHCPNLPECFSGRTATFMIMGNMCTRNCRFCAVSYGTPASLDEDEPERVASTAEQLGLRYIVITSVTRDDLEDGGVQHFAETVQAIKRRRPKTLVELLVPDFQGKHSSLNTILSTPPDVLNHNVETVPRLYSQVRPQADYRRSLDLLKRVHARSPSTLTKSGLMLGFGEREPEVIQVIQDLLDVGCRLLTLGQYLQPSRQHHPVIRYLHPEEFEAYKAVGEKMGFLEVASGPFVRSSFRAAQMYRDVSLS
ncbi:MAG: lipoyl synthase [Deltaproteobacteria bacterium]|nr:lipoyl synthase [Deltaproteobacteria bacterium]